MECSNCGAEVISEANFCSECGTKIKKVVAEDKESVPEEKNEIEMIEEENKKEEQEFINPNQCPECGSTNTKTESRIKTFFAAIAMMIIFGWIPILGWIILVLGLFGIFQSIFLDMGRKCRECNSTYNPSVDI